MKPSGKVGTSGFALIELLVILMVIGILSGITFGLTSYVMGLKDRKKAKAELAVLKTAIDTFKTRHGNYPHCPMKVCGSGECLFLSLMGYHNERGALQFPPYVSLVNPTAFDYSSLQSDPETLDAFGIGGNSASMNLVAMALSQDIAFSDPWGNDYVYEFPREDGVVGFRIYSLGQDGRTGTAQHPPARA